MGQAEKNEGNITRKRTCCLPKVPVEPQNVKPPKGLPIDFYSIKWFQMLSHSQKWIMADCNNVAFLLVPEEALKSKQHQDEKLSDKNFSKKYQDVVVEPYDLQEFESEPSDEEDDEGNSIDLDDPSPNETEAESDGPYAPGEYEYEDDGFIYNEESDISNDEKSASGQSDNEEAIEGVEE
ncbi:hypothetical protein O181_093795 [Austropuccinia psidii MF-1]|uniref:Uncharacterized protein n=1 Tax=Austropuccinia psidii MF-1 TaxID=1389203 RepID=A0A9Q3J2E1_9BASI|nr:hypothetical protein [Austropuccinia psidii MF-1]